MAGSAGYRLSYGDGVVVAVVIIGVVEVVEVERGRGRV